MSYFSYYTQGNRNVKISQLENGSHGTDSTASQEESKDSLCLVLANILCLKDNYSYFKSCVYVGISAHT